MWRRPSEALAPSTVGGGSASSPGTLELELRYSLDVNALNFCRFSLLPLHDGSGDGHSAEAQALVAVPNLVESSLASTDHFCSRAATTVVLRRRTLVFFCRPISGCSRLWRGSMLPSVGGAWMRQLYLGPTVEGSRTQQVRRHLPHLYISTPRRDGTPFFLRDHHGDAPPSHTGSDR